MVKTFSEIKSITVSRLNLYTIIQIYLLNLTQLIYDSHSECRCEVNYNIESKSSYGETHIHLTINAHRYNYLGIDIIM